MSVPATHSSDFRPLFMLHASSSQIGLRMSEPPNVVSLTQDESHKTARRNTTDLCLLLKAATWWATVN